MRKKILLIPLLIFIQLLFICDLQTEGRTRINKDYNYNFWLEVVPSTPSFRLERIVHVANIPGVYNFGEIADIHVGKEKLFIVDRVGSQIIITDHQLNFEQRITLFRDKDYRIMMEGQNQMRLEMPEGIFEAKNGDLYVADTGYRDPETGQARIVVFSPAVNSMGDNFYYVKQIIKRPKNMVGRSNFLPSKLVVDDAYRIYTVVQGGNEGIIVLNADGSFSRYFGTNRIRFSPIEYFWRRLASEEQLSKMQLNFAPPFNNIDIDSDGFIYATNADQNTIDKIARINPNGENVIRKEGYLPPSGDLRDPITNTVSSFVAISVNDYSMYAALDSAKGRIFIYNFDGELLLIVGNLGNAKGEFHTPGDVSWLGDKLVISDQKNGMVAILTPTEFGQAVIDATKSYYAGDWENAGINWKKSLEYNANYDIAYVGYGKILYMNDQYKEALEYFKLGNNRTYYSMAYKKYRAEVLRENFLLFISPLLILAGLVIYSEYRYVKKEGSS